ncbi:hypothetical protein Pen01_68240 [Phytomonospora endophytica]|nr:hypothetical protein Pen01_68240 [Phytomonospora endophytica]
MTAVARLHGLEGVVAKRLEAAYGGGASHDWINERFSEVVDMVVGGVRVVGQRRVELLVGEETADEGLVSRGAVTVHGDGVDDLPGILERLARPRPPFAGGVPGDHARGATWLDPLVAVEVSYTALTPQGRMRGGRLARVRLDR